MQNPLNSKTKLSIPSSLPNSQLSRFKVHGLQPKIAASPKTSEEMSEIIRIAQKSNWGVAPFGSGTKQEIGNSPKRFDLALCTKFFNQIPEYEPQDLVVRVESGCCLRQLQNHLMADRLWLPIDPPHSELSTLGGIVATNSSGPCRFGNGTIRDYLLGIGIFQPDGSWTQFGSRVVKNVTGYDMCKLYTGSLGTLGIFSDFYFKLKPLPAYEKSVVMLFENLQNIYDAMVLLSRSSLQPSALEFLNSEGLEIVCRKMDLSQKFNRYALIVRFSDLAKSVNWQVRELQQKWLPYVDEGIELSDSKQHLLLWEILREDSPYLSKNLDNNVKLKINILPSQLVHWVNLLEENLAGINSSVVLKAHAGNGIIQMYCHLENSVPTFQALAKLIKEWRAKLRSSRGSVIIESGPKNLKKIVDTWGYCYKDLKIMSQIKNQLDPQEILNPGRFVV